MSKNYRLLVSCVNKLRRSLITRTVINNPASDTSQYRLRSYRLLCHAEIEHYIETRILRKIDAEKNKWLNQSTISACLASLLAYHTNNLPNVSTRLSDIAPTNDFNFRLNAVISSFTSKVNRNNGIKESNVIPLLVSIGIDHTQLSQTMLNNMSSFGSNRGDTAHNSSKVQHLIIPLDEVNMVQHIVTDLNLVDDLIDQIK